MRAIFFILLTLAGSISGVTAQLTLEGTYDGEVERVLLEFSGEKYYYLDSDAMQLKLYNADHTPWKMVDLPVPSGAVIEYLYHVSEGKINDDPGMEILYCSSADSSDVTLYHCQLTNEEGTVLLFVPHSNYIEYSEIPGSDKKLIAYITEEGVSRTSVYSLPGLLREHVYDGSVWRTSLDVSGEKYFLRDLAGKQFVFYNADHSPWKTVDFGAGEQIVTISTSNISENKINGDDKLEILNVYYTSAPSAGWNAALFNEDGEILFSLPGAYQAQIAELNGLPNKIIAHFLSGPHYDSKVYNTTDFSEEMSYPWYTYRKQLEISGEIYYYVDRDNREVKVFGGDHQLRKTISLEGAESATSVDVNHISETKIDSDPGIELIYGYGTNTDSLYQNDVKLINEDGTILDSIPGARSAYYRELPGRPPKVIAHFRTQDGHWTRQVFGITPWAVPVPKWIPQDGDACVYPNPASDHLTVQLDQGIIREVRIYSATGALLRVIRPGSALAEVDLSCLTSGIYVLEIQDSKGLRVTEKLMIRQP